MLILALGMVALATAASFAAVPFSTTSTVNMMNVNAMTGLIGSVLYTPMAAGFVAAGEIISLNLPDNVPISYLPEITVSLTGTVGTNAVKDYLGATSPGTGFVQATGGAFTNYTQVRPTTGTTASGVSVQVNQNNLIISFGSTINFVTGDFIKIDGIRVDATGMAVGGASLQVSLTNVIGQATTDTPQLYVATFVPEDKVMQVAGISGVSGTGQGLFFLANGTPQNLNNTGDRNLVTITLKELFPNAFETKTGSANTYTRINFALTIPAGLPLAITGVTFAGPDGATFTNGQFYYPVTNNPLMVSIANQSPNKIESLQVGIKFGVTTGGIMPLTSDPITMAITLERVPTGALPYSIEGSYWAGYQLAYKYKAMTTPLSASIPVTVVPLTSNLLSLYNSLTRLPSGVMIYDTGFSVSNLSGSNPTTLSAYPAGTPGIITVSLYPMDGSGPLTMNTSQLSDALKTQSGLDAAGALKSKGTFVILLSQLLETAGYSPTASFSGFIRFKCNFTESTGVSVIGDPKFEKYTVGFPMVSDTPINQNLNVNINVPAGGGASTGTATGTVVPPLF